MQDEVIAILKKAGAVLTDSHFVGTSGRHMSIYVNKDALLPHAEATCRIGELFAEKNADLEPDIIVAPAMGAIILGHWTAYHMSRAKGREIPFVYTEKDKDENQIFKRGYDLMVNEKKVLVIEDTTATGLSVKRTAEPVRAAGGEILRACVIINRDTKNITSESVGVPLQWLAEIPAETYAEEECPLCTSGVPINTKVGHGKKFLEKQEKA